MTSTEQGGKRRRLRDSPAGNIIVIVTTTLVILGGIAVVNVLTRGAETPTAATSSAASSQVELTGDTSGEAPRIDSPAPDFTIFATDGEPVTLSELHGKPVWLIFGATWCSNCRAETPDIQAVQDQYGDEVAIIAIYVGENLTTVSDYADRLGLTYTQVADGYTDVGSQYRVIGLPTHYFIDSAGIVKAIEIGTMTQQAASKQLDALLVG